MNENISYRDPGEPPDLDWIDPALIDVDPNYQRPLDEARVEKILTWFDWSSFGALVVARRGDGRHACTDGQHRLEAAKRHPAVKLVPCVIVRKDGVVGEAQNFLSLNADRKNISPLDRYWAQLAAGDPEAQTVAQVCERAGVIIARYPNAAYKPSETVAVSAIRAVVDNRGAMRGREILQLVGNATLTPIRGEHIRAAELLLTDDEFRNDVDADALSESLGAYSDEIGAEAKAFAKTHRLTVTRAFASCWFRRTRKRRKAA